MNRYPLWKNLLILFIVALGAMYSAPNLFGDDPSVQISGSRTRPVDGAVREKVESILKANNFTPKRIEFTPESGLLVRFSETDTQLRAYETVNGAIGNDFTVAQNLAPATPAWLRALKAAPMVLGLDLRGGVHFLLEVDMNAAVQQAFERYVGDIRTLLRDEKLRYLTVARSGSAVEVKFRSAEDMTKGRDLIHNQMRDLQLEEVVQGGEFILRGTLSEKELRENRRLALQQNITTLRNRVNELGVSEPTIAQQGDDRIVVQLPGVQDTARAKEILGATATLEYRMVDEEHSLEDALAGRVPPGSRIYDVRSLPGQGAASKEKVLLKKQVIITGDEVIDAASGIEQQTGSPMVSVTLNGAGASKMGNNTKENVGKRMAVVFIENKTETKTVDGKPVRTTRKTEEVISVAVIREPFSKRFQTTGLDSPDEARNLALLLRAGALAAPMQIVEERTVGPSAGAENISKGFNSNLYGFAAIALFMVIYYRVFGLFSIVALGVNVLLLVAVLSILHLTLTLPGMAGIALTVGMAIDANVLINERIREELRAGISPHAAIYSGYERAFGTILDSNVTTLIAGFALFWLGSGPVRGFAVVLCFGILTSMFSAVMVSRMLANWTYGRKPRIAKVSI